MEYEQPGDSKDGALMIALVFHQCVPGSGFPDPASYVG